MPTADRVGGASVRTTCVFPARGCRPVAGRTSGTYMRLRSSDRWGRAAGPDRLPSARTAPGAWSQFRQTQNAARSASPKRGCAGSVRRLVSGRELRLHATAAVTSADGGGFVSKKRLGRFFPGLSGGEGTRSQHSYGSTWMQVVSVRPSPDVSSPGGWSLPRSDSAHGFRAAATGCRWHCAGSRGTRGRGSRRCGQAHDNGGSIVTEAGRPYVLRRTVELNNERSDEKEPQHRHYRSRQPEAGRSILTAPGHRPRTHGDTQFSVPRSTKSSSRWQKCRARSRPRTRRE